MPGQLGQPEQSLPAQGEAALASYAFLDFKGVNTRSDRTAMPKDHFYNLENLQPIGAANIHTVLNISAVLHDFAADSIYYAQSAQVALLSYLFNFATNGKIITYRLDTSATATINTGTLLSGTGSRMAQWMNTYALFVDSTGYYYWDGTTFALLSGGAFPGQGTDICVFAGRVWIAQGRLILYSAANDGTSTTNPTQNSAWLVANGAGSLNMTDPTLVGFITRLWQQNGYLYIIGATCVYALSDVYVPTGASPPTPVFTLLNVQGIIGTDQPFSVFPYNRSLMFANKFGAWSLDGVNAQRLSHDIDGTWQYLSFSPQISGGQCVSNNILCAAFLLQRANDPVFGSDTVIGMWADGQWWFANFGTLTFITTAIVGSIPVLYGFIGNKLHSMFTSTASYPTGIAMTPLWDMDDPLSDKAIIRAGLSAVLFSYGGTLTLTVDGVNGSSEVLGTATPGTLTFIGAGGIPIQFTGTGGAAINWTVAAVVLYNASAPGTWSRYVGMTLTLTNANAQLTGFYMDYKKRARWRT